MMNDDVATPTALIGKKMAPILQLEYLNEVMAESMDIVKRIDEDASMGPALLKGSPDALRADIKAWQKKHAVPPAPAPPAPQPQPPPAAPPRHACGRGAGRFSAGGG